MPKEDGKRSEHAWLASLHELLDTLRSDGWLIGPSEHMAVERVVLELAGDHVLPHDPATLAAVLGPIVSSNPREQEQFRQRFLVWSAQWASLRPGPEPVGPDEPRPKPIETPPPPATRPLKIALGVGAALVLIYAGLYYFKLLPGQSPDTGIKPIDEKTEEPRTPDAPDPEPEPEPDTPWLLWLGAVAGSWILFEGVRHINTRRWLARYSTLGPITVRRIPVRGISGVTDDRQTQEGAAVLLRTREHVATDELDVEATIQETAEAAGWITPMYTTRRVTPEFVALVDRRSGNDHQAHVIDARLQELRTQGVEISRYWFDSDPRYPSNEDAESAIPIEELAGQRGHNRLWLFADANLVQDPETGEAAPWLEEFSGWSKRNLLTVEPSANWGSAERLAEGSGLRVRPADVEGLKESLSEEAGERPNLEEIDALPPMYPEPLDEDPDAWLQPDPPEEEAVAWMLEELGDYLGEAGMAWLASCAVYPELKYELTLYLGSRLRLEGGTSILEQDHERLAERRRRGHRYGTPSTLERLSRLPWFRVGWMPDWLRERLIAETPPDVERATRSALKELLARNRPSDHPDEFVIEVAWEDPRRGSVEGAGVDRVFLRTMEDPLYVRVPREFLNRLRGGWQRARPADPTAEAASTRLPPLPILTTWALPALFFSILVALGSRELGLLDYLTENLGIRVARLVRLFRATVMWGIVAWGALVLLRRLVEDQAKVRLRVFLDTWCCVQLVSAIVASEFYVGPELSLSEAVLYYGLGPAGIGTALGFVLGYAVSFFGRRIPMGSWPARGLVRVGARMPDAWLERLAERSSAFRPGTSEPPLRPLRSLPAALLTSTAVSLVYAFVLSQWLQVDVSATWYWPVFLVPLLLYFIASTLHQLPQPIARPYTRLAMEIGCWVAVMGLVDFFRDESEWQLHSLLMARFAFGVGVWLLIAGVRSVAGMRVRPGDTWHLQAADFAGGLLPDRMFRRDARTPEQRALVRTGTAILIAVLAGIALGSWWRFYGYEKTVVLWICMYGSLCIAGAISRVLLVPLAIVLTFTACWWVANPDFEPMQWWTVFLLAMAVQMAVILARVVSKEALTFGRKTEEETSEKTTTEDGPAEEAAGEEVASESTSTKGSSAAEADEDGARTRFGPLPIITTWAIPTMLYALVYGLMFIGVDAPYLVGEPLEGLVGARIAPHALSILMAALVALWYVLVVMRRMVEPIEHVKRRILIDSYLGMLITMPTMWFMEPYGVGSLESFLVHIALGPLVLGALVGVPISYLIALRNQRMDMGSREAQRMVTLGRRMPDAWMQRSAEATSWRPDISADEPLRPRRSLTAALLTSLGISAVHFFVLVVWLVASFHEARHWPIYLLALFVYYLASTINQIPQQITRPYTRLALELAVWVAFTILVGLRHEAVSLNVHWAIWQRIAAGMALWVVLAGVRALLIRRAWDDEAILLRCADVSEGFLPDRTLRREPRTPEHLADLRVGQALAMAVVAGVSLGCWTRFHGFEETWVLWALMYGVLCLAGAVARARLIPMAIVSAFTLCWWVANPAFEPMKWWMVFTLALAVQTAVLLAMQVKSDRALFAPMLFVFDKLRWPPDTKARRIAYGVVQVVAARLILDLLESVGIGVLVSVPAQSVLMSMVILVVVLARRLPRWILGTALLLGALAYVQLSALYIVEMPNGDSVVIGFEYLAEAQQILQANPLSARQALLSSGGDPTVIWTSTSILIVNLGLGASLGLALGCLVALVYGILTSRLRRADGRGLPRVYISYRRTDAMEAAERLYMGLRERGFDVLLDLETRYGTEDIRRHQRRMVERADVVLVLISPSWLSEMYAGRRDSSGPVRRSFAPDVAFALERDRLVVPVLLEGAQMPPPKDLPPELSELVTRQAAMLRSHDWDGDLSRLCGDLLRYPGRYSTEPMS